MNLKQMLIEMLNNKASDLHLRVGIRPHLRVNGKLEPIITDPLTIDNMENIVSQILNEKQLDRFRRKNEMDLALSVAKLGPAGALALDGGNPVRQTAPVVRPLDPTGAGDSFNAGFVHAWVGGQSLGEAMKLGVACGSYSTLGFGGTAHQATYGEAQEFLKQHMEVETVRTSL